MLLGFFWLVVKFVGRLCDVVKGLFFFGYWVGLRDMEYVFVVERGEN